MFASINIHYCFFSLPCFFIAECVNNKWLCFFLSLSLPLEINVLLCQSGYLEIEYIRSRCVTDTRLYKQRCRSNRTTAYGLCMTNLVNDLPLLLLCIFSSVALTFWRFPFVRCLLLFAYICNAIFMLNMSYIIGFIGSPYICATRTQSERNAFGDAVAKSHT